MELSSLFYFSLFALVDMMAASEIHRRQISAGLTSLSVPVFSYGYYSQLYPDGEIPTSTGSTLQPRGTTSGAVTATTSAASDTRFTAASGAAAAPSNPLLGPVGVTEEEAFIASMCAPLNSSQQLDLNFPCNKILTFEVPCVLGQNYTAALQDSDIDQRTTAGDQLQCFCPGGQGADIWQNAQYCAECQRLHGATNENIDGYVPAPYFAAISSSYCAQPTSAPQAFADFVASWSATDTISLGTSTGGTDVLGSSTAISLYTHPTTAATTTSPGSSASTGGTSVISLPTTKAGTAKQPSSTSGAEAVQIPGVLGLSVLSIILYL